MSVKRWQVISFLTGLFIIAASSLAFLEGQEAVYGDFSISTNNYAKTHIIVLEPSIFRIRLDVKRPEDSLLDVYCDFYIFNLNNFNRWKENTSFVSLYKHKHIHREAILFTFRYSDNYVIVTVNSENSDKIDVQLQVSLLVGSFKLPIRDRIRNRFYIAFIPLLFPGVYAVIKRINSSKRIEAEKQPLEGEGDIFNPSDASPGTIKYCTECLKEIEIDVRVCSNCGEEIANI